jgi:F-type H+-transporting ATPase subunit a
MFLCGGYAHASGGALEVAMPVQMEIFGIPFNFNHDTIMMCAVVAVLIYLVCWLWMRGLSKGNPGRGQVVLEMVVGAFDDLVKQSLGPNRGRKYLPYIGTLFLFIWTCNMIGMIPIHHQLIGTESFEDYNHNGAYDPGEPFTDANGNGRQDPGFKMAGFEEPTKDINVPLGMALLFVLLIGHGSHIRYHGLKAYLLDYFSPGGIIGCAMFFLNVVGKFAEVVSISFRLFGNIFGGAVIIAVVSGLLHYIIMPIGLYGFFGVFVGTVQAFVFTMLALTYISMGAAEEGA